MAQLSLNSGTLFYQHLAGDQSKPTLVFLHEGLGSSQMWREFPQQLCQVTGCPGLVYDRLGYGQSSQAKQPRTLHYLHQYALEELPQVLKHCLGDKPYFLVGHSDGGSIALLHAAAQPKQLRGVLSAAAHIFVEPETLRGIEQAVIAWQQGKLDGLYKYHGAHTEQVFFAWADTWLSKGFKHWNIEYALPSITAPVLALQGIDDQYGSERQVAGIVKQVVGLGQPCLLPRCGHSPHREAPEATLAAMAEFIDQQLTIA